MTPPKLVGDMLRIPVAQLSEVDPMSFEISFTEQYAREFGFTIPGREILVDDIRVRATGTSAHEADIAQERQDGKLTVGRLLVARGSRVCLTALLLSQPRTTHTIYFADAQPTATAVYAFQDMGLGDSVVGPALITAATSTVLIEPNCTAQLTAQGDLEVLVGEGKPR